MERNELVTAAQKAILENQHNPAAPAVVQIWNNQKLPDIFLIAHECLRATTGIPVVDRQKAARLRCECSLNS